MKGLQHILIAIILLLAVNARSQTASELSQGRLDTTKKAPAQNVKVVADTTLKDTLQKPVHSPRQATIRSAILPGLGQAYNRQYWKIPLVYAAVGIPVGFYFYNNSWYKRSKFAYEAKVNNDSVNIPKIDPKLGVLSTESLRFYRNEFRRNRDYSLLYTLVAWGLNVVDATVSGHLKEFDVSDDLSLQVNPVFNAGYNSKSISLMVAFKKPTPRLLSVQ